MKLIVNSEAELPRASAELLRKYQGDRVFAIYGGMGAGKTTLIKALCHELGVVDVVQSPTFSIINEYKTDLGESVFHFDFYRIRKLDEAYDIGYEDYIYSGARCFIEWPELIESLLPQGTIRIRISGEVARTIETEP